MKGLAIKCKCGSVWCRCCFIGKHAPGHVATARLMNWRAVRHVVLTVNRALFKTGEEAYLALTRDKAIHKLIRNIERGKRVFDPLTGQWNIGFPALKVKRWMWFLEWHEDGFPHWHVLIETIEGRAGMIGGDRLRHYWQGSGWVREDYIKTVKHWRHLTGYVKKAGYFQKKNKQEGSLQGTLPAWALEIVALKIRRVGQNVKERKQKTAHEYFSDKSRNDVIDIATGEVVRPGREVVKRAPKQETYKAKIDKCGQETRVKLYGQKSFIDCVVSIPYAEMKGRVKGHFLARRGWAFALGKSDLDYILDRVKWMLDFSISQADSVLAEKMKEWHDFRVSEGWFTYKDVYRIGG